MTTIIVIAVFLNLAHAMIDAYRISKSKKDIVHWPGAAIYLSLCLLSAYVFANVWYVIPMLFIRPVVFDPLLNMFRSLNPFHVSMSTTSVIDKYEVRLLGTNGFVHWLVWLGLTVTSVILLKL